MKQNLLALFLLLASASALFSQKTIHVKFDATGANDGTSWANAYTSLDAALTASAAGDQIWVAAGTYKPATSFLMEAGVALYGGFKGTETTLAARNIAANVTILSGDKLGDDVAGTFNTNRTDNAVHVLEIAPGANATDRATVDGFTVKGGQTLVGATNPDLSRRGGGILTTGPATIRNCLFTDNYGDTGGSLAAANASAAGTLVDNCIFEKNGAASLSAGIYFRDQIDGEVNKCIFRDNVTNRGCLYMITSVDMVVDSCLFENNTAGTNPCAGMYTWQSTFTMTSSVFKNNTAIDYGAMYNDGRNGVYPFTIDKCLFEANKVTDTETGATAACGGIFNATSTGIIKNTIFRNNEAEFGGAMYNSGSVPDKDIVIDSCIFEGNISTVSRGGALYNFKARYELKNSTFDGNASTASTGSAIHNADSTLFYVHDCTFMNGGANFGGAISNYSAGDIGTYERCLFKNNSAGTSGGAMTNGFTANVTIKDCTFEANAARFGGALFAQNANTALTIQNSLITANNVESNGGAIALSGGIKLTVDDSRIELNQAATGGGITMADDTFNVGKAVIRNTIFLSNFATTQGAGINISNMDVDLTNCLFAGNQNFGDGAGGALINNASSEASVVKAVNCTFADNSSPIGAGIAQWEDTTATSVATLELQNCVFFNPLGNNYEIEAGLPEVTSKGGNLCGDISLTGILIGLNDLLGAGLDPLFADPTNLNYHLTPGSPCIDKGVAAGAPATDLEGNPRSGAGTGAGPDQGCYEFSTIGTHQPGVRALPLRLMPNPAVDRAVLVIESDWSGDANVQVFSQNGALVQAFTTPKFAGRWAQVLNVQDLPAGIYQVRTQLGAQVYEGSLVKK